MELIVDGDAKMADKDYGRKCKFRRLRRSGLTTLMRILFFTELLFNKEL